MANTSEFPSGATQLAQTLAERGKLKGLSGDPADYQAAWVKLSGPEWNEVDPRYRSELGPLDLLIGERVIDANGVEVVIVGMMSGVEEKDRVTFDGRETTRRHAIWGTQPEIEVIRGRGGGLKTDRGGWISGKFDEVFLLDADGVLCVMSIYDAHHVVANLTKRVAQLPIDHVCEVRWRLTKIQVADGDYTRSEPHFELLDGGPSPAVFAQAKKLAGMIARLSYAVPNVPLRLVVNSGPPEPPPSHLDDAPLPSSMEDYGAHDPFALPSFLR